MSVSSRPRKRNRDTWHFRLRASSRRCYRSAFFSPRDCLEGYLIASGVPARKTVLGLACHVTDSHRRPEVACVTATEIPAVVNVISSTESGS